MREGSSCEQLPAFGQTVAAYQQKGDPTLVAVANTALTAMRLRVGPSRNVLIVGHSVSLDLRTSVATAVVRSRTQRQLVRTRAIHRVSFSWEMYEA
jgi:hypothetical protein